MGVTFSRLTGGPYVPAEVDKKDVLRQIVCADRQVPRDLPTKATVGAVAGGGAVGLTGLLVGAPAVAASGGALFVGGGLGYWHICRKASRVKQATVEYSNGFSNSMPNRLEQDRFVAMAEELLKRHDNFRDAGMLGVYRELEIGWRRRQLKVAGCPKKFWSEKIAIPDTCCARVLQSSIADALARYADDAEKKEEKLASARAKFLEELEDANSAARAPAVRLLYDAKKKFDKDHTASFVWHEALKQSLDELLKNYLHTDLLTSDSESDEP